ncbi:MAG: hypothetical protein ACR2PB_13320 [Desulfocapsaceae bacterium]
MKTQISIEEIRQLEQNARKLRSEAIFETLARPFKGIVSRISAVAATIVKNDGQVESGVLGARAR